MTEKWIGKVGVVTGASSGIGATIFKDLAKAGITVVGLARRSERIEAIIAALGEAKGNAFAFKCDVTNSESVAEVFKWIEGKFGAVHILINNAGITRNGNILDGAESSKTLNDVIDTNLRGVMQCTSEAYRLMKKSNDYGMIINVNSILGHHIPFMGFSFNVYPASKFAVTALTESIRHELILADNKKVRVTVSAALVKFLFFMILFCL